MSCINMTWDCSDNQAACSNLNIFRAFVWSAPHKLRQLLVLCVNLNVVFRHRLMKQTHHFCVQIAEWFPWFPDQFQLPLLKIRNFLGKENAIHFARRREYLFVMFFHLVIQIRNTLNPLYKIGKRNPDSDLIYIN